MKSGMRLAGDTPLSAGAEAIRATAGALLGWPGDLFRADGETFSATLTIDDDARVPGSVAVLKPGAAHRAVVQVGPERRDSTVRKLCIKIPDAYGSGRDQDFMMASSADGAPLHHAVLPTDSVAALYSSLWLYLAGLQPILFGALASTTGRDLRFGHGDELSFAISAPVGQFRRIGALVLTGPHHGAVRFSGRNCGGNIWPLPPVSFY
ncbi:hypothetical protein NGTWS0302_09870 [Mycolicibacterium cyprinidarum]|uniref:Uncharacterized protein n=1 Tax=Mycolicibacterium cyprinidarum TaxID=2860311 RepID=A0ABQ4VAC0_9MYCO|nr:hypothetical protein NGTWS1702_14390 [Mycolicibacterium sp. NGTWSNA01]GJF15709.1 hypothetical protein NGTWS0302_09870 [Mycolicibacterium sp. NGTWS0302]